eukprot:XP_001703759.1 predicted protein [Chlamydomonas reinhardtii]
MTVPVRTLWGGTCQASGTPALSPNRTRRLTLRTVVNRGERHQVRGTPPPYHMPNTQPKKHNALIEWQ